MPDASTLPQATGFSSPPFAQRLLSWLIPLGILLSALAPQEALALRFVAMGDSRGYTLEAPVSKAVLGQVNQQVAALSPSPEFLIFYGDMSYRGNIPADGGNHYTYDDWLSFMRTGATGLPASLPLYLAIGNHELYDEANSPHAEALMSCQCQTAYQNFIESHRSAQFMPAGIENLNDTYKYLAYSFTADNGQTLFVVLDGFFVNSCPNVAYQGSGSLDDTQLNYLKDTLAASTAKTKFVIVHNPAFEPTDQAYPACWDPTMCTFWKYINDYNATAVLNGHTHLYARVLINSNFNANNPGFNFTNSIPQVVAGSCGAPIPGTADEPPAADAPPNWNEKKLYNYAVIDVDNSGPTGTVSVHSYCSDGTSPWSLCDTYTNVPASPAANDLLLLQNTNEQAQ